ncbi:hypothetical protein [Micromonospora sp. KC213]|uniref:hypothetical protein n=1 Tax=Micromonospora sp. KC213 TaxID=2530378 RepID=UPI0014053E7A|nr:hypothetical protein [Micromonospora sp. KC213]
MVLPSAAMDKRWLSARTSASAVAAGAVPLLRLTITCEPIRDDAAAKRCSTNS